jgi:hypothetical protein
MINVEPGVIVLELACHDGEIVRLVTGSRADAFTDRGRAARTDVAAAA